MIAICCYFLNRFFLYSFFSQESRTKSKSILAAGATPWMQLSAGVNGHDTQRIRKRKATQPKRLKAQPHLRPFRAAKSCSGQFRVILRKTRLAARGMENPRNSFSKDPLPAHAGPETGIIEFAAADGADAVQHIDPFSGNIPFQPLFKNRRHRQRQPQDFRACPATIPISPTSGLLRPNALCAIGIICISLRPMIAQIESIKAVCPI